MSVALRLAPLAIILAAGAGACSAPPVGMPPPATTAAVATPGVPTAAADPTTPATATRATPVTSATTTQPSTQPSTQSLTQSLTPPAPSDGRPVEARLSIPSLGVDRLVVEPYVGWTDDGPGTAIQNRGRAASPTGPQGGTGAGGVGNYQVTAHRNSSTAAFFRLPALVDGDVVHVDAGGTRYTYRVAQTRETSFRSSASLAEQRAAVPGRPGVPATQAMITLSTCATQEDHAAGNFWADGNDNPEHRIDKVGVLVTTGPAPDAP